MSKIPFAIGDTLWTVGDDGSLRATFGEGDQAIRGTLVGMRPGTNDRIAVLVEQAGRTLLDERFDDLAAAMDAVSRVVEDAWKAEVPAP